MIQLDLDVVDEKNLEDRFRAKFVTPLLSPFLKEKQHFRLAGSVTLAYVHREEILTFSF
jgi:hypothetical protein